MTASMAVATSVTNGIHEPAQQIVQVEVASLKFDNLRVDLGTEEEIDRLGEDLLKGQLVPILVQPDGSIADGHRRAVAAKRKGKKYLDAIRLTKQMSRDEASQFQLRNAEHRKGFNEYERFKALKLIQAAHPDWTKKQIGESVSMLPPKVTELLTEGIPLVEEAFLKSKITLGIRYEIAKCPAEQQAELLAAHLSGARSRDQIAAARKRKPTDQVRVSKLAIPFPSGSKIIISGEALSLGDVIELLQETMKAAKKASDEGIDGRTWCRVMADKAQAKGG